jgi:pyroglutamyl-peptidase
MRVVLTGFRPFGDHQLNPSQVVVEALAERARENGCQDLHTSVLPVAYASAGTAVSSLIAAIEPDAILCLGLAAGQSALCLERVALNLDDVQVPDTAGEIRQGQLIVPGGPAAYWSTLPLEALQEALDAQNVPVRTSNHAGTYVCNHVFYVARHELARRGSHAPCGLIHLPLLAEQLGSGQDSSPCLDRETMLRAVACCLEVLGLWWETR